MYAVIQTGGKQYRVKEGDLVSVEKLDAGGAPRIDFKRVLLIEDGETILVGTPMLEKALVRAEVIETYKDDKVLVFKKKRTKQFRRTRGHRQQLTKVKVEAIYPDGSTAPALETAAAKPAATRKKAPEAKAKVEAPAPAEAPEKKTAPEAKKAAAKPRKPAKAARGKAAPKAKAPVRKTATAKPAAKRKKRTKE